MTGLRALLHTVRKLVLGETLAVPIGVAVLLLTALVLREIAPDEWHHGGGGVILAGTLIVVALATRPRAR